MVAILNYGCELRLGSQTMRLHIEAAKTSFLCRVTRLRLDIQRELRVKLLLLKLERSQSRGFRLIRMFTGCLSLDVVDPPGDLESFAFLKGTSGIPCLSCPHHALKMCSSDSGWMDGWI